MPTGGRQRDMTKMCVEVEIPVVDPNRVVKVERDVHQSSTEGGHQMDPLFDHLSDGGEGFLAGQLTWVEDEHRRDVHVVRRCFEDCERGIYAGESLHDVVAFRFRQRPRLAM